MEEKHDILQTPLLSIYASKNNRGLFSEISAQLCRVAVFCRRMDVSVLGEGGKRGSKNPNLFFIALWEVGEGNTQV